MSLNLNYLSKVIQTSSKTVRNSLQALIDNNLINCEFAKFQTHDPCIITLLFFSSRSNSSTNLPIEKNIIENTCVNATQLKNKVVNVNTEIKTQNATVVIFENKITETATVTTTASLIETSNKQQDNTLTDLERVLKRHNRDVSEAPLIINFLNDTSVGLDKKPIKSIPAMWEKDLQSNLKILQFRFVEWKYQQEKEENKQFFEKQESETNQLVGLVTKIDVSSVKFDYNNSTASDIKDNFNLNNKAQDSRVEKSSYDNSKDTTNTTTTELAYFSNQTTKNSNQMNKFSNNIRDFNIRNIKNHIRGANQLIQFKNNNPLNTSFSDCDSFNFSTEELEAIKQYKRDRTSVRVIKTDDFIKRYLDIGVELLKAGKKINLDNISSLYAKKINSQASRCSNIEG
ncbi:MAG: hypothetical protein HQK49_22015 [Oligoflexia bacterium]|nr:hypothetical protein [Oligoflexia bacterium]